MRLPSWKVALGGTFPQNPGGLRRTISYRHGRRGRFGGTQGSCRISVFCRFCRRISTRVVDLEKLENLLKELGKLEKLDRPTPSHMQGFQKGMWPASP